MDVYNIYCDESCHLENDHQQVMILGAIRTNAAEARSISKRIKAIKVKHSLSPSFEVKWTKVSPAKIDFYLDLISYFFEEQNLHFRALIVPDKTKLCHSYYNHDHDTWYYKMYFELLKVMLNPHDRYRIYLDIKDTRSGQKTKKLHEILSNNNYDFKRQIIERIQNVHSHEIECIQLADLLIGTVLSANRSLPTNPAKDLLVQKMRELSGYCLTRTTLMREKKVNLFSWSANEVNCD